MWTVPQREDEHEGGDSASDEEESSVEHPAGNEAEQDMLGNRQNSRKSGIGSFKRSQSFKRPAIQSPVTEEQKCVLQFSASVFYCAPLLPL